MPTDRMIVRIFKLFILTISKTIAKRLFINSNSYNKSIKTSIKVLALVESNEGL